MMFSPVSLFVGFRYTRAKNRNHFISFISLMSIFGIALGVLVLITVLSVMNGFDREIQKQVFSMVPPVTVSTVDYQLKNWGEVEKRLQKYPEVTAVAPFVTGQILVSHGGVVQPAVMNGILPEAEKKMTALSDSMIAGSLNNLQSGQFRVILGAELAERLGVLPGETVTVITPQFSVSLTGVMPRFKRFTVAGIFRAGNGFGFDSGLAFIRLEDGQKLFQTGQAISGLHVRIQNPWQAGLFSERLRHDLGPIARITNWTDQFGEFFHAVALEKTMMFFILMLIIAVAAFNLVCTLVMAVNEKQADIAILRTLGATPSTILRIFVVQGAVAGSMGTLLGVAGGVLLARHVTAVVSWIESVFHVEFLSSSVYFGLTRLPSVLEWPDVIQVSVVALLLSLLATLYPAWRASRIQPAEALRYE